MGITYDLRRRHWNARPAKRSPVTIAMSSRPGVETHHTAGAIGSSAAQWASALQWFHLNHPSVNYSDVWYSVGIWRDGTVVELRGDQFRSSPTDSLTVVFAGNYQNLALTKKQKEAWRRVRAQARNAGAGRGTTWHGQRAATSCPGRNVIDWLRSGAAVSKTALVTTRVVPLGVLKSWARVHGAHVRFVDQILPALHSAFLKQREINRGLAVDVAVVAAQSAKETGWGRFSDVIDHTWRNTAGIKIAAGGGNRDPEAHERFSSWDEGARAHLNHLAAYTGLETVGTPHGRYWVVLNQSWAGTIRYVEDLSGRWAPSTTYADSIIAHAQTIHTMQETDMLDDLVRLEGENARYRLVGKFAFAIGGEHIQSQTGLGDDWHRTYTRTITAEELADYTIIASKADLEGPKGDRGPQGKPGKDGEGVDLSKLAIPVIVQE